MGAAERPEPQQVPREGSADSYKTAAASACERASESFFSPSGSLCARELAPSAGAVLSTDTLSASYCPRSTWRSCTLYAGGDDGGGAPAPEAASPAPGRSNGL